MTNETKNDYLMEIKIKNNLLMQKMRDRGISSAKELSRQVGVSYSRVISVLSLQETMFLKNGDHKAWVFPLCEFFNCLPKDIYPEQHWEDPLVVNKTERQLNSGQIQQALGGYDNDIFMHHTIEDMRECINNAIDSKLTKREKICIEHYYGMNGKKPKQFKEICEILPRADDKSGPVTAQRVRQIFLKAHRKLKTPQAKKIFYGDVK